MTPPRSASFVTHSDAQRELGDRLRALYRQAPSSGWGSIVVALCMVVVMWRSVPHPTLLGWLAATVPLVAIRIPLLRAFAAQGPGATAAKWGQRYVFMVAAVGVCWGVAPFLMLRPDDPLAVASFLMVLALVAAGNVASHSCYLPAVYVFLCLAVLPAAWRLALFGEAHYVAIALTLLLFFSFLVTYARVQSQGIGAAIRLRHENLGLIDELKAQTEQAETLRAQAEHASHAKSRFLAAASHDLRQPLHALGLFSASLHEMTCEPGKRMVVENILATIESLESLFNELLDLSRLDAAQLRPNLRHIALEAVIANLRARFAVIAEAKGLTLAMASTPAIIHSDPLLLERLLGNLVANAIQYTQHGTVSVSARVFGSEVVVKVRDTGIGIAQEHRERIFEEFFQIGNAERDRSKGLGLGLAIVRRIAEILDYRVSVKSQPGAGSCFSLRVPLGDPGQVELSAEQPVAALDLLYGKTILVIDDEVCVLNSMRELLGRWGCVALTASAVPAAVEIARTRLPDLVVADLRLPAGSSGVDAVQDVRDAVGGAVPAIIITGETEVEALMRARIHGFPILHKPVRPVKLRAVLTQLLTGHETPARPARKEREEGVSPDFAGNRAGS
jgi:signal transduction histidine kinase/ActR/RegA family two-component response regulator